MKCGAIAGIFISGLLFGAHPASAVGPTPAPTKPPPPACESNPADCIDGEASGGTVVIGGNGGSPGTPQDPGSGGTSSTVDLPPTYKIYDYAPTCTGNSRTDAGVLCGAAVNSCQPTGKGIIQFWVWEATYVRATHSVLTPPGWDRLARPVCLGPDDPGVPAIAAVAGIVQRDFKDLVVLKGEAHVTPKGTTLVNYDNGFWTDARAYVLPAVQILGHRVVVTATPDSYDWFFGDGEQALDAGPGRQGTRDVHHVYGDPGRVAPHVEITWTGTFTIDGGAPLDVIGTAQTTGNGTPVQVREARAQLVG
jgi:hypothetical protein